MALNKILLKANESKKLKLSTNRIKGHKNRLKVKNYYYYQRN